MTTPTLPYKFNSTQSGQITLIGTSKTPRLRVATLSYDKAEELANLLSTELNLPRVTA